MKTNEWHWARLKKDLLIDNNMLLHFLKSAPFILPKGTVVWVYTYKRSLSMNITIGPKALKFNCFAYQSISAVDCDLFLEPLE